MLKWKKCRAERFYGRLRVSEYKQLVSDFKEARIGHDEIKQLASRKGSKLTALLEDHGRYWWAFYDLPFRHHLALMIIGLDWQEKIKEIAKTENPQLEFLKFASAAKDDEASPFFEAEDDEKAAFVNVLLGIFSSLDAIGHYSLSVNELLEKARRGDKTALLQALSIDRCVIFTRTAQRILSQAQLTKDKAILSGVFKKIKNPHSGLRQYVDLRYLHRVLQESETLLECSGDELLDLVGDKLGLYQTKKGDPVKGLRTLFKGWEQNATR